MDGRYLNWNSRSSGSPQQYQFDEQIVHDTSGGVGPVAHQVRAELPVAGTGPGSGERHDVTLKTDHPRGEAAGIAGVEESQGKAFLAAVPFLEPGIGDLPQRGHLTSYGFRRNHLERREEIELERLAFLSPKYVKPTLVCQYLYQYSILCAMNVIRKPV